MTHQIEQVNGLLNHLPTRFITHPPPGGVQGVAEVASHHQRDRASLSGGLQRLEALDRLAKAEHEANLRLDAGALRRFDHPPRLIAVQCNRLLDQNMDACLRRHRDLVGVSGGW